MLGLSFFLTLAVTVSAPDAPEPEPFFPILKDGKWGFIDQQGKVIIEPRYDFAQRSSEGYAAIMQKLDIHDRTELAVFAIRQGLIDAD